MKKIIFCSIIFLGQLVFAEILSTPANTLLVGRHLNDGFTLVEQKTKLRKIYTLANIQQNSMHRRITISKKMYLEMLTGLNEIQLGFKNDDRKRISLDQCTQVLAIKGSKTPLQKRGTQYCADGVPNKLQSSLSNWLTLAGDLTQIPR